MARYDWDQYFMTMAYLVAMKSKDPRTRVGAVIVGPDQEIRATGYNGFPRGYNDSEERYNNKEHKLQVINHAEENAILHCARIGVSAKGCKLYCPWVPCSHCAKSIIQVGIIEVIYDENFPGNRICSEEDLASMRLAREMFNETKVQVRAFKGGLINISGLHQGREYPIC
jgi:dCMP deaminase